MAKRNASNKARAKKISDIVTAARKNRQQYQDKMNKEVMGKKGEGKTNDFQKFSSFWMDTIEQMGIGLHRAPGIILKDDAAEEKQKRNPFLPANDPLLKSLPNPFTTRQYWERSINKHYPETKPKTPEVLEEEKRKELKKAEGRTARLCAVIEWCQKGTIKTGVIFIRKNGSYDFIDYIGGHIGAGTEGAIKATLPGKMKILYTIYNAEAEQRKKENNEVPTDDLELLG